VLPVNGEIFNMNRILGLSRAQRGLLAAIVVALAFIAPFAMAEVGLRVRHRIKYGNLWGIEETYKIDDASGLRIPVPGGSFGGIRINSLGFRGPELAVPKPPSTVRVAFLGSSTTYCAEVSNNENTWPHLVTEALKAESPDVNVDYVNAGVPGYGIAHSLRNLETRVGRLNPDIIVIYEGHNDLTSNSFDLAVKQGIASKRTEQTLSWPTKYSLFWYLVEKNLFISAVQKDAGEAKGKLTFEKSALTAPFHRELKELVEASKRVANRVVLVTFSTRIRRDQTAEQQTRAAVTSLYYMPYMSIEGLLEAYASYNEVVRQVAEETGAFLIADENVIPADAVHFADSVHFTDKGSHAMAERVVQGLLKSAVMREIGSGH